MSRTDGKARFLGFDRPTYTTVPDEVFDELLPDLTGAETKVLLYIIRHTFGWKKDSDDISLKQMAEGIRTKEGKVLDRGAGVSKSAAAQAVKQLVERGVIVAVRNRSLAKGDEPTTYTLHFRSDPVSKIWTGGYPENGQARVQILDTQQTVKQETIKQHGVVVDALTQFGISPHAARDLGDRYPEAYILSKLDLVQWLQEHQPSTVGKNPAGYLRRAIEDDWTAPPTYQTPEQRSAIERQREVERVHEQAQRRQLEQEQAQSREDTAARLTSLCPSHPIPGTPLTTTSAWDQTLAILESQMTAGNFAFIKQARLVRCDGYTAVVAAAYSYHLDQLSGRFHPHLTRALSSVLGTPIHCAYTSLSELTDQTARHPTGAAADPGDVPLERDGARGQEPLAHGEPNGHHPSPQPRRGRPPKTELVAGP